MVMLAVFAVLLAAVLLCIADFSQAQGFWVRSACIARQGALVLIEVLRTTVLY